MIRFLKSRVSRSISRYFERRAKAKLEAQPDLWSYLSSVHSPSTGCSYNDYWALYSYIRREKPKEVLELGSGVSTGVMGYALLHNGSGRLTSMEESEEYSKATATIIPKEVLPFIELVFSPAIEKRHGLFIGVGYAEIPERPYEFVFVDGPQYERETSYDVDLLEIVEKSDVPVSALIDSRAGSCLVYNLFLKHKFYFDRLQNIGYLKQATKRDLLPYSAVIARELGHHAIKRTVIL